MRRLYRSKTDRKICGVCGGLAAYFGVDPTLVRLIWIIASMIAGSGVLFYIIAALIMPEKPDVIDVESAEYDQ